MQDRGKFKDGSCEATQYKLRVNYIDTFDLLENIPLVKFVRNYIRDRPGFIFQILSGENIDDEIGFNNYNLYYAIYGRDQNTCKNVFLI